MKDKRSLKAEELEGEEENNFQISLKNETYDSLLKNRQVLLNEEIDEGIVEKVVMPLLELNEDDSMDTVCLYINSIGGSVMDSLFLSDIIEKYKKPLNIICLGYAFSAAFELLMSGKNNDNVTRFCYPNSVGLLHVGHLSVAGNADRVHDQIEFDDRINQKRKISVLHNSKISEEEYDAHIRQDWYFSAEDMLNYQIIDKIL